MQVGTDNGGALGAGEVKHRYHMRRFCGTPALDDIPGGHWAEKQPHSELWDIKSTESS
jgi:hypothetical protein